MSNFDRNNNGTFQKDSSIYSVFHGTDSYLLEDELNESQWDQIEKSATENREQLTSGILKKFTINAPSFNNFFTINSIDGNPLSFLVDGYILRVGENNPGNLPAGLVPSKDSLIVSMGAADASDRTDLIILEVWFEILDYNDTIRKFGGIDTPVLTNNLYDARIDIETTRRVQLRWRIRSINNKSSIDGVTAYRYDGTDSGIAYTSLSNIYAVDTGMQYAPVQNKNSLKSPGIVYAIPLFTVARKANIDVVTNTDIADISPKVAPADSFLKDAMTDPSNFQQDASHRLVTDTQIATWDSKLDPINVQAGTYPKVTVDSQGRVTNGNTLSDTDIPTLTLGKISDAGTVASKNTGTLAGNVPILDTSGKLDTSVLPGLALTTTNVVASQTAMLALTAETGDLAVRTDLNKTFVLQGTNPTILTDWQELLTPTDSVQSVAGKTGVVTLNASDVGAVDISGGTMTGLLTLSGDPTSNLNAATKQYVDAQIALAKKYAP